MIANDEYEQKLWKNNYKYVVGVDESGMGSLIGNIYISAVIFPINIDFQALLPGLNDSKKKSAKEREQLYHLIKKYALSYSTATASIEEVNEYNVYWARFIAARRALEALKVKDYVLMDGNVKIPKIKTPQTALIKGDTKSISIAAASILAKVDRDQYVTKLSTLVHKDYDWASNKGYHSKKHVAALKKHGRTEWHRDRFLRKFEIGGENEDEKIL